MDGHRGGATRETLDAAQPTPPIAAVAVTSQYMSVIPVAADGMPTGPCVLWMDTRGAEHNISLLNDDSFVLFVDRHGLIPLPSGNDNVAHIHVLQTFHPEAYAGCRRLRRGDGLRQRPIDGSRRATQSTMYGQMVCDNRTWGVMEYDPDLVACDQPRSRQVASASCR